MNVRPGDIARIVADSDNVNRLVSVVRGSTFREVGTGGQIWVCEALQTLEAVTLDSDAPVRCPAGAELLIADWQLRRIDGGTGDDETLSWKRVPGSKRKTTSWLESQPWQREVKA